MADVIDAFWRAAAYCLHPRIVLWSVLPVVLAGGLVAVLGWAYWEAALQAVRAVIDHGALTSALMQWMDSVRLNSLRVFVAPLVVIAVATPLATVLVLLLVVLLMTPAVVRLVARRRFPGLDTGRRVAWWRAPLWLLACCAAALMALVLSVPLWFVPPLVLVLPPLIWGWLVYQMLGYAVLAPVADAREMRFVLRLRRWPLMGMGVACGFLGAIPALVWTAGAAALALAPFVIVLAVWLNALVFVFACGWFAHFLLPELQRLRAAQARAAQGSPSVATP